MKISVVIPTYEYKGRAPELLTQCINSIVKQTFASHEIIIVDHSVNDIVYNHILQWNNPSIKYKKNDRGRGNSSINMNEGIKIATGDFIKIMHMDDWFCNEKSLEYMSEGIKYHAQAKWGGFGFNHYYESQNLTTRFIKPHINSDIGTLLGCPSVSFFYNDKNDPNLFDEELIVINDSDMHMRLGKKYGGPLLINDTCVTIRMHDLQVSNTVANDRHLHELQSYRRKYLNG